MRAESISQRDPQNYSLILEPRRSGLLVSVEPLHRLVREEEPPWQKGLQRDSSSHQTMEEVLLLCVCLGPKKTVVTANE